MTCTCDAGLKTVRTARFLAHFPKQTFMSREAEWVRRLQKPCMNDCEMGDIVNGINSLNGLSFAYGRSERP
jgi:hypothetical protein